MIHDPGDGTWGCSGAFFTLLDDGVFGGEEYEIGPGMGTQRDLVEVFFSPKGRDLSPEHREILEHWRVSQLCLLSESPYR